MKKSVLAIFTTVSLMASMALFAQNAVGVWEIIDNTPMGKVHSVFILKADGTGSTESMMEFGEFDNAIFDGDAFEVTFMINTPMGAIAMTRVGNVLDDKISGTTTNRLGEFPFSGVRQ